MERLGCLFGARPYEGPYVAPCSLSLSSAVTVRRACPGWPAGGRETVGQGQVSSVAPGEASLDGLTAGHLPTMPGSQPVSGERLSGDGRLRK